MMVLRVRVGEVPPGVRGSGLKFQRGAEILRDLYKDMIFGQFLFFPAQPLPGWKEKYIRFRTERLSMMMSF
jgi:hypothetical protein